MSNKPGHDHPWYSLRGRGQPDKPYGPGRLQDRRTVSDELLELELSKTERFNKPRIESFETDGSVRAARDPSYAPLSNGGGMRKPVRYD